MSFFLFFRLFINVCEIYSHEYIQFLQRQKFLNFRSINLKLVLLNFLVIS